MYNRIFYILAIVSSLFTAFFLSLESYLTLRGQSLCSTAACQIVSHYLVINETVLITLAAGFFWILSILLFFARRYPRQNAYIPFWILVLALSVDGTLIGFQFFTIQQKCLLCISVAASLIIISILYCLSQKSYLLLFCCLFAWIGGFLTNGIMKMPAPTSAIKHMVLYQKNSQPNSKQNQTIKTLIFSMECPHCLQIITTLASVDIKYDTWQFASIDKDEVSLMKLSKFRQEAPNEENPFKLLKNIKEEAIQNYEISKAVKESTSHTLTFLSNLDISTIPILIIDNAKGNKQVFLGKTNILHEISSQN